MIVAEATMLPELHRPFIGDFHQGIKAFPAIFEPERLDLGSVCLASFHQRNAPIADETVKAGILGVEVEAIFDDTLDRDAPGAVVLFAFVPPRCAVGKFLKAQRLGLAITLAAFR